MAAISKAWVTIADGAVDPDSPLDATLMTGIRDDLVHLREWVGAGFFAGAVQDHNHDGSNSALIQIGANALRNGSFEDGLTGWAFTDYSGGSHTITTSNHRNGAKALEFTSTVLANGGGDAVNGEFIPCSAGEALPLHGWVWASAANVSSKIEAIWYDNTQSLISTDILVTYTSTPTTATHHRLAAVAPANARFCKIKLTGGIPAVGASTGTVRFDGLVLTAAAGGMVKLLSGTVASAATLDIVMTALTAYKNKLLVLNNFIPATDAASLLARVSTNGGSSYDTGATTYGHHTISGSQTTSVTHSAGTDTSMTLTGAVGNAAGEGTSVHMTMMDTTIATLLPKFFARAITYDSSPNFVSQQTGSMRLVAQDTDAIRILFSSGNIASGTWELYGYN